MSSGPAPTTSFSRRYLLSKTDAPGVYTTAATGYTGTYTLTDVADAGKSDSLTQLGDVQKDAFVGNNGTRNFNRAYVGETSDKQSVVAVSISARPTYFLYTNNDYTVGTTINSDSSAFALCFVSGSRILTACGEVAVEDLRVGDLAVTASGAQRPIRWIGHRTMDPCRHPRPHETLPVRIRAGALGDNRPVRDLVVSPGHSLCLDVNGEVLIPAYVLVNGTTVTQEEVESVTYWHVELDSHDILIAEGQPTESYLDMGNRGFFAESGVVSLGARPDADAEAHTHADFCRPFHDSGTAIEEVRARLQARAEMLGWTRVEPETWADVHLEVDGQVVQPKTSGLFAYFVLPAGAQDVWLISPTSIPCHVGDNADRRPLGLCLSRLSLHDGLGKAKPVALDDPLLRVGFHAMAKDHRWTAARAQLPAALLQDMEGQVLLLLDLFAPALPRWIGPQQTAAEPRLQPAAVAA